MNQQQHNQQFQYIPTFSYTPDTIVKVNDSGYADYLYDTLNLKPADSTYRFELKEIVLPSDSTAVSQDTVELKTSIFVPYKVKPQVIKPVVRTEHNYDWLTGLFLLCLVVLVWIRYEGEKRIGQLFRAILAKHNVNQLLRDGDIVNERITIGLMFIYLISASTLIITMAGPGIEIPGATTGFLVFSFIAGALLILWLLKLAAIYSSGKLFRTRIESDEYLVTNLIFNAGSGLIAFPFVFAGYYAGNQISLYIAAGVFVLGIILRFIRSIFVGLSAQTFPVVYLFLYLCTLEILPLLVIYKTLLE